MGLRNRLVKAFANALFGKCYADQFAQVSAELEKRQKEERREGRKELQRSEKRRDKEKKERCRASWNRIENNAARIHYQAKNGTTPSGAQHYRYRVQLNMAISEQIVCANAKYAHIMQDKMTCETFLLFVQDSERGTPIAMNSRSVCINNREFVEALMRSISITRKVRSIDVKVSENLSKNEGEIVLRIEKQSNDEQ